MFPALIRLGRSIGISNTRSYARKVRSAAPVAKLPNQLVEDIGIKRQYQHLHEAGVPLDDIDENFFEESEGDFYKFGRAYDDVEHDQKKHTDLQRLRTVRQKYFNETTPNLLTWSEKEQIRFLHDKDPEEWTPKKISESFPVTENIAKKLLTFTWKPASDSRIARHDASVMRNWKELKENTLDGIPASLRRHFLKFTDRKLPPRVIKKEQSESPYRIPGEFESIVVNALAPLDGQEPKDKQHQDSINKGLTVQNKAIEPGKTIEQEMLKTTFHDPYNAQAVLKVVPSKNIDRQKYMTLSDLQDKIGKVLQSGKELDASEQYIIDTIKNKELSDSSPGATASMLANETSVAYVSDPQSSVVSQHDSTTQCEFDKYPEYIKIPKKAWKKGGTYKVRDCYYDDDGQFLYRVPGM